MTAFIGFLVVASSEEKAKQTESAAMQMNLRLADRSEGFQGSEGSSLLTCRRLDARRSPLVVCPSPPPRLATRMAAR